MDTDYTVSGVGASGGGVIEFTTAPIAKASIVFLRNAAVPNPAVDNDNSKVAHGSLVTTTIAARSNGARTNGVLGGLWERAEAPNLTLTIYRITTAAGDDQTVQAAKGAGTPLQAMFRVRDRVIHDGVHIVNMSFGGTGHGGGDYGGAPGADYMCPSLNQFNVFCDFIALTPNTLFLAAAGNHNMDATGERPASLTKDLPNVISVAAVASSTECENKLDSRAVWHRNDIDKDPCNFPTDPASNFGSLNNSPAKGVIDLAAPSPVRSSSPAGNINKFRGTSSATPVVAGTAALLYSLEALAPAGPLERPDCIGGNRPGCIKQMLQQTADDITATWSHGVNVFDSNTTVPAGSPMRRLNVLAAVQRVLPPAMDVQLGAFELQAFVSDRDAKTIHLLDLDPMTGNVQDSAQVQWNGQTPLPPGSIVTSPDGLRVYAAVEDTTTKIAIINPRTGKIAPPLIDLGVAAPDPSLALSRDGRYLFGAAGRRLFLVDTYAERAVTQLPAFDPNTGHVNNSTNLLAVPVPVAGDGFVFANRLTPLNPPPAGCAFCVATSTLGRLTVSPS